MTPTRARHLALVVICALVLPSCFEMRHGVTLNADGSGLATFELEVEKMLLMGRSVEDLRAEMQKDLQKNGVTFRSQREEGSKVILLFDRRFSKCSELTDESVTYDCVSGDAGPFRRVHRLSMAFHGNVPIMVTVTARMPGGIEFSNGQPAPGGGVTWSVDSARGAMSVVSSTRTFPRLGALSTAQMFLVGAASLFAAVAVAGLVWLAPRVPPWLRRPKRFCTKCGRPAKAGPRFCNGCGGTLPEAHTTPRASLVAPLSLAGGAALLAGASLSMAVPREGPHDTVRALLATVAEERLMIAQAAYLSGDLFTADEDHLRKRLGGLGSPGALQFEKEETSGNTAQVSLAVLNDEGTRQPIKATLERRPGGWRVAHWDATAPPAGWESIGSSLQALADKCAPASAAAILPRLEEASKTHGTDAGLALRLAMCCERAGDVEGAERAYKRALAMYPDRAVGASYNLARLYGRRGDSLREEEAWRDLLRRKADDPYGLQGLSAVLVEQPAKVDEALALAKRLVSLKPSEAYALATLGWAHYRKGEQPEAAKYLREAMEKEPTNSTYRARYDEVSTTVEDLVARGDGIRAAGRYEEAIAAYDAALHKDPNHAAAQQSKAEALAEAVRAYVQGAQQLLSHQRYDDAIAQCDRALLLAPGDPGATSLRSRIIETKKILGYQ